MRILLYFLSYHFYTDSNVHILMSLLIEKGLAARYLSPRHGLYAQVSNLLLLLLTPIAIFNTWSTEVFSLFGATFVCFSYSIVFLKLWSYCQVSEFIDLKISLTFHHFNLL